MKTTTRSVTQIKTMTGTTRDSGRRPQYTYMRLAALEMERHRRELERDAASKRADACQLRCDEIEREMVELHAKLRKMNAAPPAPTPASVPTRTARTPGDVGSMSVFRY